MNNRKIALIGKTGCGKSATGNTILGREAFISKSSSTSVTKSCTKAKSHIDGRRVTVVDTPGLFDKSLTNEDITDEVKKCITLLAPGPHVFLLVIQIGRFTPEEKATVEYIQKAFGEEAAKYIMILFTRGDDLDKGNIESYIQKSDSLLKNLLTACGQRYHVFNNKKKDRAQVKELLQKIDRMVKENGGNYYTNDMLQEAEAAIKKEKERILKDKEEEIRRVREEMETVNKQQIEMMKQQADAMKMLVQTLQKQQPQQVEIMLETYEDQARTQAEEVMKANEKATWAQRLVCNIL